MRSTRNPTVLFILLAFVACTPTAEEPAIDAPTTEADVAAFRQLLTDFDAAAAVEDADALAALYVDSAVRMEPDMPAWIGNAAIRDGFAQGMGVGPDGSPGTWEGRNVLEDAVVEGDVMVARSSWSGTFTPDDGSAPQSVSGKSMTLCRRQPDGTWKVVWDIWNGDAPAAD